MPTFGGDELRVNLGPAALRKLLRTDANATDGRRDEQEESCAAVKVDRRRQRGRDDKGHKVSTGRISVAQKASNFPRKRLPSNSTPSVSPIHSALSFAFPAPAFSEECLHGYSSSTQRPTEAKVHFSQSILCHPRMSRPASPRRSHSLARSSKVVRRASQPSARSNQSRLVCICFPRSLAHSIFLLPFPRSLALPLSLTLFTHRRQRRQVKAVIPLDLSIYVQSPIL